MKTAIINFLEALSLGKHNHGLYHKKKPYYATWISGLISIVSLGFLLTYAIIVLVSIVNKEDIILNKDAI
jgi:amino acid transporter